MLPEVAKLLTLQDRDQRIKALQTELTNIPRDIQAKEAQIDTSAKKLDDAKSRLKQIEVERKALELQVETKQTAIAKYKGQQLQTRKNDEFTALRHEIESAEQAISALEDSELVLMEETEKLQPVAAAAEATHRDEKQSLTAQISTLRESGKNVTDRLGELQLTRASLTEGIDEDLLETYARLFKSKGGNALVELDGDVCTGCHVRVTTQTALAVRNEKSLVNCPNCGRFLHLPA